MATETYAVRFTAEQLEVSNIVHAKLQCTP